MASESQIYVPGIGTMGRTGCCGECGAAIYQKEAIGKPGAWSFPENLVGPKYHAIEGGLVSLDK